MSAGRLKDRIALDAPSDGVDSLGGATKTYTLQFNRWGRMIHMSGDEAVSAARLAGRSVYKVQLRGSSQTRQITPGWRLRLLGAGPQGGSFPGAMFDIKSVDAVTDRAWVWLVVEGDVTP